MLIRANLLFHEVQRYLQSDFIYNKHNNQAKTTMFYNVFFNMDGHIIIVDAEHLNVCMDRVHEGIILCVSPPEQLPDCSHTDNDILILNDPLSEKMIYNILNHVLDRFNTWEQRMSSILYHERSFQVMIEEITELMGLPISLCDRDFRYIAFSQSSGRYIQEYVTEDNGIPIETIRKLQSQEEFKSLETKKDAFEYIAAEPCICKNVFSHGKFVGRLAVIIDFKEDEDNFCKEIFNLAAPFVEALYEQYDSFANYSLDYRKVHNYMNLIFHKQTADHFAFQNLMRHMELEEEHALFVLEMTPNIDNYGHYSVAFFCEQLERNFPGCFAIGDGNSIIVLADATLFESKTKKSLLTLLEQYLIQQKYKAGCSRVVHTLTVFEALTFAHTQAGFALECGNDESPIFFYDDYALEFLIQNGCMGANYRQLCHPAILKLKEHDEKQHTSFTQTLYVYMNQNMNAVAAAKALFIHRSSFINRMERMKELTELRLEEPQERLYLNLSFHAFKEVLLAESSL